jgi:hypothetical protein
MSSPTKHSHTYARGNLQRRPRAKSPTAGPPVRLFVATQESLSHATAVNTKPVVPPNVYSPSLAAHLSLLVHTVLY